MLRVAAYWWADVGWRVISPLCIHSVYTVKVYSLDSAGANQNVSVGGPSGS